MSPKVTSMALYRIHVATLSSALCIVLGACAHRAPNDAALYQQLGGVANITAFTDKTIARAAQDPRTRRSFEGVRLATLQKSIAAQICAVADGPCVYDGATMRDSHADLAITGSEFDALVQMLREEMDAADVGTGAKNELLRRLAPMRRDIVVR